MKETYLQSADIEGNWKVSYSARQRFFEPDTDPDERAIINLDSGIISGSDPFGGLYSGDYSLDGNKFTATVGVTTDDSKNKTVFEGLNFPFLLELSGEYLSPDYFSVTGRVKGRPEFEIVINCERHKEI